MSEPVRPVELWGVWSDEHDLWLANQDMTFAFFGSRKLAEHRQKTTPGVADWRVVPVPTLDAPPVAEDPKYPYGCITSGSLMTLSLPLEVAAKELQKAGCIVFCPKRLRSGWDEVSDYGH